jgi:peptidyl-prolyl cis-trans isomerase C
MKTINLLLSYILLSLLLFTYSSEITAETDILAQRGKGIVTQSVFEARVSKIPKKIRPATLRDGGRLQDLINDLLLQAQLVAAARDANFDTQKEIIDRMNLAADRELAGAWLQYYVESQPAADYEMLAQEYFQLHQNELLSEDKIDVSHILISTKERPDQEAMELANSIRQQLIENPAGFDTLVTEYSEDPSSVSNNGSFTNVKKGDMVRPFEDAAFAMKKNEISKPIKTEYGYHIIRLDAYYSSEKLTFESVKDKLIESQRLRHEERVMTNYLNDFGAQNVEMSQEALEELVRRQFGEDYIDPHNEGVDSE